jgi:hypothetical protein
LVTFNSRENSSIGSAGVAGDLRELRCDQRAQPGQSAHRRG